MHKDCSEVPSSWTFINLNFKGQVVFRRSLCVTMSNSVTIGQTIGVIWRVFRLFKMEAIFRSVKCMFGLPTKHVVVVVIVQNLVGIEAVGLIKCNF